MQNNCVINIMVLLLVFVFWILFILGMFRHFVCLDCELDYLYYFPRLIDWFLVFNSTFSNISAISWQPVLVVEEAQRAQPIMQATGKLYHLRLRVNCPFFVIYKAVRKPTQNPRRIGDRLAWVVSRHGVIIICNCNRLHFSCNRM